MKDSDTNETVLELSFPNLMSFDEKASLRMQVSSCNLEETRRKYLELSHEIRERRNKGSRRRAPLAQVR